MILIGIFIVIIAALIFYAAIYFKNKNPIEPLVFEKASIEGYINNCVKKTAEDGLKLLGKQGGLINLDENKKIGNLSIANLFYSSKSQVPSIEKIQDELSFYVNSNLNICLKDFEDFKKQGWNVDKGSITTKTQINENDVLFEANFPLKISDKENSIIFEKFFANENIRLKYIYEIVNKIVDFRVKHERQIDATTLSNYEVYINVYDYGDFLIFNIVDYKSLILKTPYEFNFAVS